MCHSVISAAVPHGIQWEPAAVSDSVASSCPGGRQPLATLGNPIGEQRAAVAKPLQPQLGLEGYGCSVADSFCLYFQPPPHSLPPPPPFSCQVATKKATGRGHGKHRDFFGGGGGGLSGLASPPPRPPSLFGLHHHRDVATEPSNCITKAVQPRSDIANKALCLGAPVRTVPLCGVLRSLGHIITYFQAKWVGAESENSHKVAPLPLPLSLGVFLEYTGVAARVVAGDGNPLCAATRLV